MKNYYSMYDKARVINFSDAVFSIAMTLLVLELSIPNYQTVLDNGTWVALRNLIPSFSGLLVSFLVIALYWVAHLRIMKYVSIVDSKLLWVNIFLLLFIVLLPFSTAFYVNGFFLTGPFVFYCFNLSAIALFNLLIVRYILKNVEESELTLFHRKMEFARAVNGLLVWILAGFLAFIFPTIARGVFVLIFLFNKIIAWYLKKKHS